MKDAGNVTAECPTSSSWAVNGFTWYCRGYFKRHFRALRASNSAPVVQGPLVVYMNHASWWDPVIGLLLKEHFYPQRTIFAPIDAVELRKYGILRNMGFFGVEQRSTRGGVQLMRTGMRLLKRPSTLLALTPQAGFVDVRERPVRFAPGLGRLASRTAEVNFLAMAVEYVMWNQRLPEVLVRFGRPLRSGQPKTADQWTSEFEREMESTQDELGRQAQRRDASAFTALISGGAGQGGVYDLWRSLRAKWRGETFQKEHACP